MKKFLVLLSFALCACSSDNQSVVDNTPEGTVNAYFTAVEKGNFEQFKSFLPANTLKVGDGLLKMQFDHDKGLFASGQGIATVDLKWKEGTDYRRYHATITLVSGEIVNKSIAAKDEDGKWKIIPGG